MNSSRVFPLVLVLGSLTMTGVSSLGVGPAIGPSQAKPEDRVPLALDVALSRRTILDYEKAALDPSGRHLAFAVRTPTKHRDDWWTMPSGLPMAMLGARVRVVEIAGGKSVDLGAEGSSTFSPAWSPDGSKLAFYSDEGGAIRAWIYSTADGKSRLAADLRLKVHIYSTILMPPTWSPDGSKLLVPALPGSEVGSDPRVVGVSASARSSARGKSPVRVLTTGNEPLAPPPAERLKGLASPYRTEVDVSTIDVRDGTSVVLLAGGPGRPGPAFARYSPSGRYLVTVSPMRAKGTAGPGDVVDLGVIRVGESKAIHVEEVASVYDGHETYSGDHLGRSGVILAWHPTKDILLFLNDNQLRRLDCSGPDAPRVESLAHELGKLNGEYLAFASDGSAAMVGILPQDPGVDSPRAVAIGLVPLSGGVARRFAMPAGEFVGQVVRVARTSLWEPSVGSATMVFAGKDGSSTVVRRLDFARGTWADLRVEPATLEFQGMSSGGTTLVAILQGYDRSPDFYRLNSEFVPEERIGSVEPRLDGQVVGSVERFETVVPIHDGSLKKVRTAVLLPPGAKRGDRLPAIVHVYGGSNVSDSSRRYGGEHVATVPAPVFTSRGYAVLHVDAPLGPEGQPGHPAEELRDAILPQVYRAAELGYVDIARVAIAGQSYGGYSTAALVTQTNLFRAAIAVSGIYDLPADYGVLTSDDNHFPIEWAEKGQGRMGQPPWSDLRLYLDSSPYHRADRVRTPLLIIHGRDDKTCPVRGAEQMFSALRRLERTAQLAVYEGEGHVVYEWELANAIDATNRMLEFLDRHLKKN